MCAIGIPDSSPILSSEPHPLTLALILTECLLISFYEDLGFRNHPTDPERQQATELEYSSLSLLQYLLSLLFLGFASTAWGVILEEVRQRPKDTGSCPSHQFLSPGLGRPQAKSFWVQVFRQERLCCEPHRAEWESVKRQDPSPPVWPRPLRQMGLPTLPNWRILWKAQLAENCMAPSSM